jgi:hypothetical protein
MLSFIWSPAFQLASAICAMRRETVDFKLLALSSL